MGASVAGRLSFRSFASYALCATESLRKVFYFLLLKYKKMTGYTMVRKKVKRRKAFATRTIPYGTYRTAFAAKRRYGGPKKVVGLRAKRQRNPRPYTGLAQIGQTIGYPREQLVTLRYSDYYQSSTVTAGVMNQIVFSANGIFDPDITSTGHQPLMFDTYAAMFNHYYVVSSRVRVVAVNTYDSSVPACAVAWGVYLDDSQVIPTSYTAIAEQGKSQVSYIMCDKLSKSVAKKSFDASKFWNPINISTQAAAVTANPSDQAYFNLWYQPVDQASNISSLRITFHVTIDYLVKFMEPKDPAQS